MIGSERVCETLDVAKVSMQLVQRGYAPGEEVVKKAVGTVASRRGITENTVYDKMCRQWGGLSRTAARNLFVDALSSTDHLRDDLLAFMMANATQKDDLIAIRVEYLGIFK